MRQEIAVFLVSVLAAVRGQFPFFQDNFFFGGCPGVEVEQDFSLEMVRLLYVHAYSMAFLYKVNAVQACADSDTG